MAKDKHIISEIGSFLEKNEPRRLNSPVSSFCNCSSCRATGAERCPGHSRPSCLLPVESGDNASDCTRREAPIEERAIGYI